MGKLFKRANSPFYWVDYTDEAGKRQRKSTGVRDKVNALKILASYESEAALGERGVKSTVKTAAKEPLTKHIAEYETALRGYASERYAHETIRQVKAVADFAGWVNLRDMTGEGLQGYLTDLKAKGRGARTIQTYASSVSTFAKWLMDCDPQRLAANPFSRVKTPSLKTDRRYSRRMILQEEWTWLARSLGETTLVKCGMAGPERRLLYQTAIETGLRRGELIHITKSSLRFSGTDPHIFMRAHQTKNGTEARQYVSDALANALQAHTATKMPAAKVFRIVNRWDLAATLRDDMTAARRLWFESLPKSERGAADPYFLRSENAEGELIDFHALRHTCGSWLAASGVTLHEVKQIMRHASIQLTFDTYGHIAAEAKSRHRNIMGQMLG